MKHEKQSKIEKHFPYKFTPLMILLAIGVILLCLAGIGISIFRIVTFGLHEFADYLKSPLIIVISLFCIIVVISLLIKSQYVINSQFFIVQFGFIKNKYPIKDISSLVLDSDTAKLSVYLGEPYLVLSLDPNQNDNFVKAVREVNPKAEFTFTLASSDGQKKGYK